MLLDAQKQTVQFSQKGVRIDLGGIAKGYSVDRGIDILKSLGYTRMYVSAGGDSRIVGDRFGKPWMVGIRDPRKGEGAVITRIPLADAAISTSGDYERFFEEDGVRYHHIIDPHTGHSASKVRSATVIGYSPNRRLQKTAFKVGRGMEIYNRIDTSRDHRRGIVIYSGNEPAHGAVPAKELAGPKSSVRRGCVKSNSPPGSGSPDYGALRSALRGRPWRDMRFVAPDEAACWRVPQPRRLGGRVPVPNVAVVIDVVGFQFRPRMFALVTTVVPVQAALASVHLGKLAAVKCCADDQLGGRHPLAQELPHRAFRGTSRSGGEPRGMQAGVVPGGTGLAIHEVVGHQVEPIEVFRDGGNVDAADEWSVSGGDAQGVVLGTGAAADGSGVIQAAANGPDQ